MDFGGFILFFLLCALLGFSLLVSVILGFRKSVNFKRATVFALGVLLILIISAGYLYREYFLNEPMPHLAANGDYEGVKKLLDKGASPNAYGVDGTDRALAAAARGGHISIVKLLLKKGAVPNQCGGLEQKKSALQWAIDKNYQAIAELLVLSGANPNFICL